jgi:hypothetical protein
MDHNNCCLQAEQLYPQIAARDEKELCTATFLEHLAQNAPVFATWASLPLNDLSNKKRKSDGQVRQISKLVTPTQCQHIDG